LSIYKAWRLEGVMSTKAMKTKRFPIYMKPKQIMGKVVLNLNPKMEHENLKHNMKCASAKNEVQMKYILITY
jgi:hypothetical protein